jgi:hypothetical protein
MHRTHIACGQVSIWTAFSTSADPAKERVNIIPSCCGKIIQLCLETLGTWKVILMAFETLNFDGERRLFVKRN